MDAAGRLFQDTSTVHMALSSELIFTSEDKIRLSLMKHEDRLGRKNAWATPLGILSTVVVALITSDFHEFLFPGPTWQAVFLLSAVITGAWLLSAGLRSKVSASIDDVVAEIKKTGFATGTRKSVDEPKPAGV